MELSVNELSLLLPNIDIDSDVEQSGSASAKEYIDKDAALQTALNAANIDGLTVETQGLKVHEIKLDFDDGEMVYEVEYVYDGYEYEVEIGAISGKVVAFEKSLNTYYQSGSEVTVADKEAAKAYVLSLVGLDETEVSNLFAEQIWYYRGKVYEIFFQTETMCYQYCVGQDGTVIEEYYEMVSLSDEDSYLTRDKVVDWFIDNNIDGITRLDSLNGRMRVYSEKTVDGRLVYELSFVLNGNLYVYKIDAVNKVIESREITEFQNGNGGNGDGFGDKFEHGKDDWYWNDWDFDFDDDDLDDFDDDDFDDGHHGGFGDHRGEYPYGRPVF